MNNNDFKDAWKKALEEMGINEEFLLRKTNEWIEAIQTGKFKPKNRKRELNELKEIKIALLSRLSQKGSR